MRRMQLPRRRRRKKRRRRKAKRERRVERMMEMTQKLSLSLEFLRQLGSLMSNTVSTTRTG
jgi:hypothetical protein